MNTLTLAGVWNEQPAEFLEAYTARVPMGRMLDAREALGAVVFLAVRRLVVRHRRERRRRRRLVGLVIPDEIPNLIDGADASPRVGRVARQAPPGRRDAPLPASRAPVRRTSTPRSRPHARAQPAWAERTAVERGDVVRELALRLRDRREEASAASSPRRRASRRSSRSARPTRRSRWASSSPARAGASTAARRPRACRTAPCSRVRQPLGVAGLIMSLQHAAAERRLEGVPVALLRQRSGREAVGAHACLGVRSSRELAREAGVPAGVLNVVQGSGPEAGAALVEHPRRRPRQLHRAPRRPGAGSTRRPGAGSRRSASSSAARTRSSSATTPISRRGGALGARLRVLERRAALRVGEPDRRLRRGLRGLPRAARRGRALARA